MTIQMNPVGLESKENSVFNVCLYGKKGAVLRRETQAHNHREEEKGER